MRTVSRFYDRAEAKPAGEGYAVRLDGRTVKTPGRGELVLPTRPLAEALAAEWAAQDEVVKPHSMPMTAIACTAIDVARPQRADLVEAVAAYAETDLVCYWAEAPAALVERQRARWQPLLDWAALAHDARLEVTTGILPAAQPPEALGALRRAVEGFDAMGLAALSCATRAAGSLVIALALAEGELDAAEAFEAAELERTVQIEEWGEEAEARKARAAVRADLEAAERFLALLAPA